MVIFQFFWRLGTVSSRVFALILYWSAYDNWVLFVVALHWICVFLALIVPNKIFMRDETVSYPNWILKLKIFLARHLVRKIGIKNYEIAGNRIMPIAKLW